MAVDRAKLKEQISKLSAEDREAFAEELGLARDASKADILKAYEALDARVKKLETPAPPSNNGGESIVDKFFSIFK